MRIPFLQKPAVKKVTGEALGLEGYEATNLINKLLHEFPELLAAAVVDVKSARTLAAYTAQATLDPYKLGARTLDELKHLHKVLTAPWLRGQQLSDFTVVLDEQLHILRPVAGGRWFCVVAVRSVDTNMALLRDVVRRHTN
jgi:hypothetical protein